MTTIMDCEDSVSTVDAEDKVLAYRNWLGLVKGDLTERFDKAGDATDRTIADDRTYTPTGGGGKIALEGSARMRGGNHGHLMRSAAGAVFDGPWGGRSEE